MCLFHIHIYRIQIIVCSVLLYLVFTATRNTTGKQTHTHLNLMGSHYANTQSSGNLTLVVWIDLLCFLVSLRPLDPWSIFPIGFTGPTMGPLSPLLLDVTMCDSWFDF